MMLYKIRKIFQFSFKFSVQSKFQNIPCSPTTKLRKWKQSYFPKLHAVTSNFFLYSGSGSIFSTQHSQSCIHCFRNNTHHRHCGRNIRYCHCSMHSSLVQLLGQPIHNLIMRKTESIHLMSFYLSLTSIKILIFRER